MSLTIFAQTFGTYQGNAHSAVLRIYCNQNFESTDSTMHSKGAVGSNSYFYSLACTITNGSINVPQFGHPLPIDTDIATTVFTAGIYTRNGQLITTVLANYRLDSNMLPSTNWNAIKLFSDDNNIRISGDVYTKQQVDELLSQIVVSVTSLANTYSNSLPIAISSIGSTKTMLLVDANTTLSTSVTIPSTLILDFRNGAVITKSGSGSIVFQGIGLTDPESQVPVFSGFSAGNISWTGSTADLRPSAISTELFDTGNTSLSDRLDIANEAFQDLEVKFICYPRTITRNVNFHENTEVFFTDGDYPSTYQWEGIDYHIYAFGFRSNNYIHGSQNARIYESNAGLGGIRIMQPEHISKLYHNIIIENLSFIGVSGTIADGSESSIALGNSEYSAIRYCYFEDLHGYVTTVGGDSTGLGFHASHSEISHNYYKMAGPQSIAMLNGSNILISNNYINGDGGFLGGVYIDIEPNAASDSCDQIIIQNNTIVLSSAYAGVRSGGINAQAAAGIPHGTNVVIRGNQILGLSSINWPSVPALTTAIGTHGIDGLTISDNSVMGAWGTTISSIHCRDVQISGNHLVGTVDGSGYHLALTLTSVANAIITGNSVNEVFEYDSDTGAGEDEEKIPATSSGSVITAPVYNGYKYYDFDVGHNVFFNGNTYTISAYSNITQNLTVTVPVGTVTTKTWVSANVIINPTNTITITAHGYNTGCQVTLSTTGVLPAHTPPSTYPTFDGVAYYFIIRVDANTIKLANSLANALANVPIALTDTGSGTATITPMVETRFSSNTFHDNFFPDGYLLYPYGTSQIGSTALDGVITSVADANYTAKNSDGTIVYTSLTTGRTVNLPDATFCKGKQVVVIDGAGSAGTNNITLDGNGSQTIDGSATKLISTNYGAITIKSDGANWLTSVSASAGLSIGSPVTGGAASRVLFEDSSQNLATSSIFGFNPGGSGIFNVGTLNSNSVRLQPDYGILFEDSVNQWLRMGASSQVTWDVAANGASLTPDVGMGRFAVGVAKLTNGSTGIKALFGGGAAVASATALPLPTGSVFHVTGTTTITSIVATNLQSGVEITLIFDGALTLTDGGNLKLAGNFVTTADDTIKLVYDGTNFYEIARSVN